MENFIENIVANNHWILKINVFFTIFFLLVTIGFFCVILYLRISKILRNRIIEKQKEIFSDFITRYLFDDETPSEQEIKDFKNEHITSPLAKKIAIKVLLIFEENFKGDTNQMIKKLFYQWELSKIVEADLKSGKWFRMARAIYVASELNLKNFGSIIEKYLDAEKDELRQQAMLYFIQLSHNAPLDFLDRIKKPLTRWEQIYIEECLKSNYSGTAPDFSRWLNNKLSSVQAFSIKMTGEYNQFENIPELVPFLSSPDQNLKREAIRSLANLGYPELILSLRETFIQEPPAIKSFILKTIIKIGSIDDFLEFEEMIPENDWVSKQVYFKLRHSWEKELSLSTV